MKHGIEEVRKIIKTLAEEHPGRYLAERTEHKNKASISYSYEDCIAGCVIKQLEPEVYDNLLEYEETGKTSFSLYRPAESADALLVEEVERRDVATQVVDVFTRPAFDLLQYAQREQDNHVAWSRIAEDL